MDSAALFARVTGKIKPMCPGYARVYLAWVDTPVENKEEREKKLSLVRAHLVVCGCAGSKPPSNDWIFQEEHE